MLQYEKIKQQKILLYIFSFFVFSPTLNLYVVWGEKTFKLELYNDNSLWETYSIKFGESIELPKINVSDKIFVGWKTECGTSVTSISVTEEKDIVLTAVFDEVEIEEPTEEPVEDSSSESTFIGYLVIIGLLLIF